MNIFFENIGIMLRSSRKTRSTSHFRVNKGSFEGYLQFPFKQIYIQKSRINPGSSRPCPWFHHGPAKVDSDEPISELPKHLQKQLFLSQCVCLLVNQHQPTSWAHRSYRRRCRCSPLRQLVSAATAKLFRPLICM